MLVGIDAQDAGLVSDVAYKSIGSGTDGLPAGSYEDTALSKPSEDGIRVSAPWALTNGLTQYHLSDSDDAALGGDLAYQYGVNGTVPSIGFDKVQDVLTSSQFGTQAQTLRPLVSLQDGVTPLC